MELLQNKTRPMLFRRIKYTHLRLIKIFALAILVWNITNYLSYIDKGKNKLDVQSVSNPLTLESDNKINRKYCESDECKFLFAYHVPEQETSANFHFYSFIQLAEMLNRTIVLVNVQHSRLESCQKFPFNFYYNVDIIKEMFPKVEFITQQDFLNWTRERNNKPA